jgi:uncharacterized membrane protein YccC
VTLTIAVVLKPEVGGTIERAALRITGTLVGLFLASLIFRWISPEGPTAIVFIAGFTFLLRWAGAGNYGVFVVCISGIVVFLLDLSGVSARDAISARAINTLLGGGLALLASYFWPVWERTKVSDAIARMLDAYREYFHSAVEVCTNGEVKPTADLDQVRLASRVSRSNFQASMNRLDAEPGFSRERRLLLSSVQSSSNRLAHSLMALEAGGAHEFSPAGKEAFQVFANDVEKTLQLLSQFLRGGDVGPHDLPDLRHNFEAFIRTEESLNERHALVQTESDRITNSLNTLREQIGTWVDSV